MAAPVDDAVQLTGDARIDGLVQGSRWQFSPGTNVISYSFSVNDTVVHDWEAYSGIAVAVREALRQWSSVANIAFVEQGSGTVFTDSTADVAFTLTGDDLSAVGAIALGVFPSPDFADLILVASGYDRTQYPQPEGDVFFDQLYPGYANYGPGGEGHEIVLHEIGHALGLKHPDDDGANGRPTFDELGIGRFDSTRYTVMSDNSAATGDQQHAWTPMPLDILAIQRIYGANMSYRTGDDRYELGWGAGPMRTIWDAGGTDMLQTYSHSGMTLDLRPGAVMQTAEGDVVGIAYNTIIETAIGSASDERFIGNVADNRFVSGGGRDRMQGGGGNDTYVADHFSSVLTIVELAGQGTDTVQSYADFALPANVEHLVIGSDAARGARGVGNALANELTGSLWSDTLRGLANDDTLRGMGGDDTLEGGAGGDRLEGDGGIDRASYATSAAGVIAHLGQSSRNTGDAAGDSYFSIEHLAGSRFGDALAGDGAANVVWGLQEDDTLDGLEGNDTLLGGIGNDLLSGRAGRDMLLGGAGSDRFDYDALSDGQDVIVDFTRGAGGDQLDVSDVLVGYTAGSSSVSNFVRLSGSTRTTVSINADGAGTDFVPLLTLSNVQMSATLLDELVAQGNLLLA